MSQLDIKYSSKFKVINNPMFISYEIEVYLPDVQYYINEEEAKEKIIDYLSSIFKLKEQEEKQNNLIKPSGFNLIINKDKVFSNVYKILLTISLDTMKGYAYGLSLIETIKENIKYAFERYLLSNLIRNIHSKTISGINLKLTSVEEYTESDYIVLKEYEKKIPLM